MRFYYYAIFMAIIMVCTAIATDAGGILSKLGAVSIGYYLLIAIGSVMVYGTNMILKKIKKEDSVNAMIALKMSGLGIAILGMLLAMNII